MKALEDLMKVDYSYTFEKIDYCIRTHEYLINIFAPASVDTKPILKYLLTDLNCQKYSAQETVEPQIIAKYSKELKLLENQEYFIFSTYFLKFCSIQIPILRERTTHPVPSGNFMIMQDDFSLLNENLKSALFSIHKNEKRENEFRDEIQILKDKGILNDHGRIMLDHEQLQGILQTLKKQ